MTRTTSTALPRLPIPEPLRGKEPGTWAHFTITVRLPEIARRTLAENDFPPEAAARLEALIQEIPQGPIRPLQDPGAPDQADWDAYVAPVAGQDWLEVPWFFAETYFYRRILEATGYFQPGPGQGVDPYRQQKRLGLESTRKAVHGLSRLLRGWLAEGWHPERFQQLLHMDLWGNRADLSLWPAEGEQEYDRVSLDPRHEHLLVDETPQLQAHLEGLGPGLRVDFMVDNAGFELITDLALAVYLLSSQGAAEVYLHLKPHPTFVSDAMIPDVEATLAWLQAEADPDGRWLGQEGARHRQEGRLHLVDHFYWTSPLAGWEMPLDLQETLRPSHLVISKGDANYRRLLGDRHWPFTAPFQEILAYFPAPILALRTLKSEVACGLTAKAIQRASQADPEWQVDGQWGMIQFALGRQAG